MAYASYEQAIARKATSDGLVKYVVEQASLLLSLIHISEPTRPY